MFSQMTRFSIVVNGTFAGALLAIDEPLSHEWASFVCSHACFEGRQYEVRVTTEWPQYMSAWCARALREKRISWYSQSKAV